MIDAAAVKRNRSPRILLAVVTAGALLAAGGLLMQGCRNQAAPAREQGAPAAQEGKVLYTCPMHHEVIKEQPGKCPICGMNLDKIQYTCPMHPQVVKDLPGKCPICGMTLEKKWPSVQK